MNFELKYMSAEETMSKFEQLCQMDEAELRKLFENSDFYAKLKNLTEKYDVARKERTVIHGHWISRKKLINSIGAEELINCLSDADILNCELNVDEDGTLWFTEEQGRVLSAMCIAIRKFIADFPGVDNVKTNTIGEAIKDVRIKRGQTQKALGLKLGFPENAASVRVAQYESNARDPRPSMVEKIECVLHCRFNKVQYIECSIEE